ncbi:hypothetical protein CAI21_21595 [Alkalilimnicola ehrlichii]|uniref:Uncharacterized protein n=1 Tax=Alkalilimnicola ehrlichii TaxID=351052 RepID=A0A3E0WT72_9GAMM|nr:hypothetical protein [Alkalilimnicola ehrlichii]RFA24420.1 hypothetical protein CAI21_21595 [Alkalilimnicola ehrlichii]RFA35167.1 hypothetical protein CAL65_13770 [Alkalilimnicola ehrlichii]
MHAVNNALKTISQQRDFRHPLDPASVPTVADSLDDRQREIYAELVREMNNDPSDLLQRIDDGYGDDSNWATINSAMWALFRSELTERQRDAAAKALDAEIEGYAERQAKREFVDDLRFDE